MVVTGVARMGAARLGAARLGAAICGAMLLLWRRVRRGRVLSAEYVATALAAPLLGVMPHLVTRGRPAGAALAYLEVNADRFSEVIRTIRTAVVLAGVARPWRTIGVVAGARGAGGTTLATNLALALGQFELVLLIGADAGEPGVADWFALDRAAPGLSELLAGAAPADICVQHHAASGIAVLPPGAREPGWQVTSCAACAAALAQLAQVAPRFDRIVVDVGGDTAAWAAGCDVLVCVVTPTAARLPLAQDELARLRQAGARVLGVVVNLVDASPRAATWHTEARP